MKQQHGVHLPQGSRNGTQVVFLFWAELEMLASFQCSLPEAPIQTWAHTTHTEAY